MGNTYLYEFKEKALENAILSFKNGEKIIQNLLKEEMVKEFGLQNQNLIKELTELRDIFTQKLIEVEEELEMKTNLNPD